MKIDVEMILLEKSVLVQLIKNCLARSLGSHDEGYEREVIATAINELKELDLLTDHEVTTFVNCEVKGDS